MGEFLGAFLISNPIPNPNIYMYQDFDLNYNRYGQWYFWNWEPYSKYMIDDIVNNELTTPEQALVGTGRVIRYPIFKANSNMYEFGYNPEWVYDGVPHWVWDDSYLRYPDLKEWRLGEGYVGRTEDNHGSYVFVVNEAMDHFSINKYWPDDVTYIDPSTNEPALRMTMVDGNNEQDPYPIAISDENYIQQKGFPRSQYLDKQVTTWYHNENGQDWHMETLPARTVERPYSTARIFECIESHTAGDSYGSQSSYNDTKQAYEIVLELLDRGSGYQQGDELIVSNKNISKRIRIETVDDNGGITGWTCIRDPYDGYHGFGEDYTFPHFFAERDIGSCPVYDMQHIVDTADQLNNLGFDFNIIAYVREEQMFYIYKENDGWTPFSNDINVFDKKDCWLSVYPAGHEYNEKSDGATNGTGARFAHWCSKLDLPSPQLSFYDTFEYNKWTYVRDVVIYKRGDVVLAPGNNMFSDSWGNMPTSHRPALYKFICEPDDSERNYVVPTHDWNYDLIQNGYFKYCDDLQMSGEFHPYDCDWIKLNFFSINGSIPQNEDFILHNDGDLAVEYLIYAGDPNIDHVIMGHKLQPHSQIQLNLQGMDIWVKVPFGQHTKLSAERAY